MGENCGISTIVFGLNDAANYNKILIYLKDNKDNMFEAFVDEFDTLQTTSVTFDNLQLNKYYTVVAELQYTDGSIKTIEGYMPSQETAMFEISLLSSSESGSGGQPTGGEVSKPSTRPKLTKYSSITPTYTDIKNQGSYQTCIANSLSTAMSIFKARATGIKENYSVSYIYGSDGKSNMEYMYFEEAIQLCRTYGSPRWEFFQGLENDGMSKSEAVSQFRAYQGNSITTSNAKKQKFGSYEWVNFYDCDSVAYYIKNDGYFMFNFKIPNNFHNVGSDGIVPQPDDPSMISENTKVGGSSAYSGANHSIALIGLTKIDGVPYWIAQNSWGDWWGKNGICFIPLDWGYDSDEYWALESYGVTPGSNYDADHPDPVYNIKARSNNNKEITLSWNSNETNVYYAIFARQKYTTQWFCKYVITDNKTSATISVDSEGVEYEFMIITMKDYYCSYQSDIIMSYVNGADFTITNLGIYERSAWSDQITISWDYIDNATGYNYRWIRNWDGYEVSGSTDVAFVYINPSICDNWQYGVTHTFYVQAYNDYETGEWYSLSPITTFPHKATTLTASQSNGYLSGNFEVESDTNITHIRLRLYPSGGVGWDEFIEEIEYDVTGIQNPSGSYQFDFQCEKGARYIVHIWTVLKFSDMGMPLDCDGLTEITSGNIYQSIVIDNTDFTINNLQVRVRSEYDNNIFIRYDKVDGATGYNYRWIRNDDGYEVSGSTTRLYIDINPSTCDNWQYGVRYTFYIQAYNNFATGEWYSLSPITTFPHMVTNLTVFQNNGYISGQFEVTEPTNVTHIKLKLYRDTPTSCVEEIEYNVVGSQTPSGSYQFSFQCEDGVLYVVYAYTILRFSDMGMSPDCDGVTELESGYIEEYITINIAGKPELWSWTTDISSESIIPTSPKGFHPVTAVEWNEFTERINDVRAYMYQLNPTYYATLANEYEFDTVYGASNGQNNNPTVFTIDIYNQVVNNLIDLSYWAGHNISTISSGQKLTASLFTDLSNQLNYIINQL